VADASYQRAWRARNKEKARAIQRRWKANHPNYYAEHRDEILAQKRDYHIRHRDKKNRASRAYAYKTLYGITIEQYDALLAQQGGRCAICPEINPGRGHKYFTVDHDHETGEVRGLLCIACNLLLGYAKDHIGILESAQEYLVKGRR
jgi:hypothetical protein